MRFVVSFKYRLDEPVMYIVLCFKYIWLFAITRLSQWIRFGNGWREETFIIDFLVCFVSRYDVVDVHLAYHFQNKGFIYPSPTVKKIILMLK